MGGWVEEEAVRMSYCELGVGWVREKESGLDRWVGLGGWVGGWVGGWEGYLESEVAC